MVGICCFSGGLNSHFLPQNVPGSFAHFVLVAPNTSHHHSPVTSILQSPVYHGRVHIDPYAWGMSNPMAKSFVSVTSPCLIHKRFTSTDLSPLLAGDHKFSPNVSGSEFIENLQKHVYRIIELYIDMIYYRFHLLFSIETIHHQQNSQVFHRFLPHVSQVHIESLGSLLPSRCPGACLVPHADASDGAGGHVRSPRRIRTE